MTLPLRSQREGVARRPAQRALRDQHRDLTRDLILEAFSQVIAEGGGHDFAVQEVADRAGVSHRTVYRQFPSRQALLDALADWLDRRLVLRGGQSMPHSAAEIPEAVERNFRLFDEEETATRAMVIIALIGQTRSERHEQRTKVFREVLAEVTGNLEPDEARRATAIIRYLVSSQAWFTLRGEFGLDGRAAGSAVAWAVRTLLNDLQERDRAKALKRQVQDAPRGDDDARDVGGPRS